MRDDEHAPMKLTGDRNRCTGCGAYFRSGFAFARHRTGAHGVDRRCRTADEMRDIGMVQRAGWWAGSANPRFAAAEGDE